ncbi:MAG: iron-sulfur cluster assembly accessory protein [Candidatus Calescibacterium sp.]|nr:iron-sulfur cluster assembly accessory protein [Candidatus Calescibacterium sp.]MDW8133118.1 iron-sulfur cluster assembly accessory protein [Candidatus Calescibacterium sp.]
MLSLTEKAKEKIKEMIKAENGDYYLRVYAMPAGCCGLEFGMELTNETDSSDNFLDFNDFKVVVDDFSFPFIENLQIDIAEKEGKTFFVLNSLKVGGCGCSSAEEGSHGCCCGNGSCGCH